jgi:hypothetical protein
MYLKGTGWEVVNWIHVAQDKEKSQAFLNTEMNIRIHKTPGICWLAENS